MYNLDLSVYLRKYILFFSKKGKKGNDCVIRNITWPETRFASREENLVRLEQFKIFNELIFLGVVLAKDHIACLWFVSIPNPKLTWSSVGSPFSLIPLFIPLTFLKCLLYSREIPRLIFCDFGNTLATSDDSSIWSNNVNYMLFTIIRVLNSAWRSKLRGRDGIKATFERIS